MTVDRWEVGPRVWVERLSLVICDLCWGDSR